MRVLECFCESTSVSVRVLECLCESARVFL